jgi:Nucleotide-diphospho-sugar transferase
MSFTEEQIAPCILEEGGTVLVTLTNSGYLLYTLNLLKSLQPYGLDKKVFIVCMDTPVAEALRQRGYHTHSENREALARFCPWNTKGYDEICYMKLRTIHKLLSMGRNVLLMDGDVVFRKNPQEAWREWWSAPVYDVYIQNDAQRNQDVTNLCTGYMWIRATPVTQEAYDCISAEGQERYRRHCAFLNNDQTYFNEYVKPVCRVYALPLEDYPNGKMYMENKARIHDRCVLVHFNWLKGHHKLVAMRQNRMWLLTAEEER